MKIKEPYFPVSQEEYQKVYSLYHSGKEKDIPKNILGDMSPIDYLHYARPIKRQHTESD